LAALLSIVDSTDEFAAQTLLVTAFLNENSSPANGLGVQSL